MVSIVPSNYPALVVGDSFSASLLSLAYQKAHSCMPCAQPSSEQPRTSLHVEAAAPNKAQIRHSRYGHPCFGRVGSSAYQLLVELGPDLKGEAVNAAEDRCY